MKRDKLLPLQALAVFVLLGLLISLGLRPHTTEFDFISVQETLVTAGVVSVLFGVFTRWFIVYGCLCMIVYVLRLVFIGQTLLW